MSMSWKLLFQRRHSITWSCFVVFSGEPIGATVTTVAVASSETVIGMVCIGGTSEGSGTSFLMIIWVRSSSDSCAFLVGILVLFPKQNETIKITENWYECCSINVFKRIPLSLLFQN